MPSAMQSQVQLEPLVEGRNSIADVKVVHDSMTGVHEEFANAYGAWQRDVTAGRLPEAIGAQYMMKVMDLPLVEDGKATGKCGKYLMTANTGHYPHEKFVTTFSLHNPDSREDRSNTASINDSGKNNLTHAVTEGLEGDCLVFKQGRVVDADDSEEPMQRHVVRYGKQMHALHSDRTGKDLRPSVTGRLVCGYADGQGRPVHLVIAPTDDPAALSGREAKSSALTHTIQFMTDSPMAPLDDEFVGDDPGSVMRRYMTEVVGAAISHFANPTKGAKPVGELSKKEKAQHAANMRVVEEETPFTIVLVGPLKDDIAAVGESVRVKGQDYARTLQHAVLSPNSLLRFLATEERQVGTLLAENPSLKYLDRLEPPPTIVVNKTVVKARSTDFDVELRKEGTERLVLDADQPDNASDIQKYVLHTPEAAFEALLLDRREGGWVRHAQEQGLFVGVKSALLKGGVYEGALVGVVNALGDLATLVHRNGVHEHLKTGEHAHFAAAFAALKPASFGDRACGAEDLANLEKVLVDASHGSLLHSLRSMARKNQIDKLTAKKSQKDVAADSKLAAKIKEIKEQTQPGLDEAQPFSKQAKDALFALCLLMTVIQVLDHVTGAVNARKEGYKDTESTIAIWCQIVDIGVIAAKTLAARARASVEALNPPELDEIKTKVEAGLKKRREATQKALKKQSAIQAGADVDADDLAEELAATQQQPVAAGGAASGSGGGGGGGGRTRGGLGQKERTKRLKETFLVSSTDTPSGCVRVMVQNSKVFGAPGSGNNCNQADFLNKDDLTKQLWHGQYRPQAGGLSGERVRFVDWQKPLEELDCERDEVERLPDDEAGHERFQYESEGEDNDSMGSPPEQLCVRIPGELLLHARSTRGGELPGVTLLRVEKGFAERHGGPTAVWLVDNPSPSKPERLYVRDVRSDVRDMNISLTVCGLLTLGFTFDDAAGMYELPSMHPMLPRVKVGLAARYSATKGTDNEPFNGKLCFIPEYSSKAHSPQDMTLTLWVDADAAGVGLITKFKQFELVPAQAGALLHLISHQLAEKVYPTVSHNGTMAADAYAKAFGVFYAPAAAQGQQAAARAIGQAARAEAIAAGMTDAAVAAAEEQAKQDGLRMWSRPVASSSKSAREDDEEEDETSESLPPKKRKKSTGKKSEGKKSDGKKPTSKKPSSKKSRKRAAPTPPPSEDDDEE